MTASIAFPILLATLLQDVARADTPVREYSLKSATFDSLGLEPIDDKIRKFITFTPKGAVITCSPEQTQKADVRLRAGVRLHGDFRVHASLADVELQTPRGWSVGPFVRVEFDGSPSQVVTLFVLRSSGDKLRLMSRSEYPETGTKAAWQGVDIANAADELKISRVGSQLRLTATLGGNAIELPALSVPTDPVVRPTIGLGPGNDGVRATCTFTQLVVEAEKIADLPASKSEEVAAKPAVPLEAIQPVFESEPEELSASFIGNNFDFRSFEINGNNTLPLCRPTETGLRTYLPGGAQQVSAAVKTRFRVAGDFEVTARFSDFQAKEPPKGTAYAFLRVDFDPEGASKAVLSRSVKKDRGDAFITSVSQPAGNPGEEATTQWGTRLSAAKSGRMRIVRRGRELAMMVAEGDAGDFHTIQRAQLHGDLPVGVVLVGVGQWRSDVPISCHWSDLSVRAEQILLPGEQLARQTILFPVILLTLGVAVFLAGGLVWYRRTQSVRAKPEVRDAASTSKFKSAAAKRGDQRMRTDRREGFTLLEILVVIGIIAILIALLVPAVQAAREAARRTQCLTNLRQIGQAISAYEASYKVYPFGVGGDDDTVASQVSSRGSRRFALHSQILPYVDQGEVFDQINFAVAPFYPDDTGDPRMLTGHGPNETAAQTTISLFVCPSDINRMMRPWGVNSYRSCNGSNWAGRQGNGIFGQITSIRPGDIQDGLAKTAAFSERILGDDDDEHVDLDSDLFGLAAPWMGEPFREWCSQLTVDEATTLDRHDSNSGHTWLEGNMTWTRYNHFLPPHLPSCKGDLTWNGVAMTANSRHSGLVHLLFADGSAASVNNSVDLKVWRAIGTIAGNETVDQSF